jgi:hypothetical protein
MEDEEQLFTFYAFLVNDAKGEHLAPIMSRSDSLLEKTATLGCLLHSTVVNWERTVIARTPSNFVESHHSAERGKPSVHRHASWS